jgi:hypothetical protein
MDAIAQLPDRDIREGGVVAHAFLRHDITTFRRACQWVKDLPYGSNSSFENALVLFEDQRGTCFTKHGVIARLAEELRLDVYKNIGFYRLNEEIVTGIDALLRPYGLTFVPQIHCFLEYRAFRIDLTEGNCHGKKKTIEDYDFVVRIRPDVTRDEMADYYATYFDQYASIEPRLAAVGMPRIASLLQACHEQMSHQCSVMARSPSEPCQTSS